jgi:hypothetical protein
MFLLNFLSCIEFFFVCTYVWDVFLIVFSKLVAWYYVIIRLLNNAMIKLHLKVQAKKDHSD